MFSYFIQRPVLASVISVLLVLLGLLSLSRLPMAQFPAIAPPEVNVSVEYTGANAETVTKAALVPIERAINGVPGMKYMSSDAGNDGVGVVQVIFEVGTDPDVASVNVQNRVAAVMGELPSEVIRNGVKIAKEENSMLLYLNLFSSDSTLDEKFLYNFADIHLLAELKRVKGVGFADIMGAREYAMRIWLKPDKLLAYGLGAEDVVEALKSANVEAAPGKVGESTDKEAQELQYVIRYAGRFQHPEEYKRIPLKSTREGEILRIGDVADVEFGTTYFDVETRFNGKPAASIMVKQLPGSNASEVISEIKSRMERIKGKVFLKGMDYEVSYDVSRFLDAAVSEVVKTLVEAFLLVSLVVFVFLQNGRLTLIPALTVPVSLIGTFAFMLWMGFSLNLITLFSLVLAIGIVIDDAIVVVEAVHARMEHHRLSVLEATHLAIREMAPAILAITLVMAAVFIPTGFMEGPAGIFFRQFSYTMAVAIVLSAVTALTLTPALCVLLLRSGHAAHQEWVFFRWFNAGYNRLEAGYGKGLAAFTARPVWLLPMAVLVLGAFYLLQKQVPSGFIPNEDQGSFYVSITTPPGATLERTKRVVGQVRDICQAMAEVQSVSTLSGTNILSDGTGATYGTALVNLLPWDDRNRDVESVMAAVQEKVQALSDARIEIFPPPAVPGYGNASGFELRLLDKTGKGDANAMQEVVDRFLEDLIACPEIENAFTIYEARYPQYEIVVDPDKASQKGVSVEAALSTLQTLLGSEYASNFIRFGQMYKVMVQALPQYRARPEDVLKAYVKNKAGQLVPFSVFCSLKRSFGVDQVTRYNMFPSAEMNGDAAAGYSSGQVLAAIQRTAAEKLPQGYDIDWAGISRDEVQAGNLAWILFGICLVFVYLLLAGQYESYRLPFPVLLFLPAGLLGSFFLLRVMGLENNIYAQIAMVMLIGQLGKNGILMVEFAIQKQREGKEKRPAILEAARARLRPILMTSFAFVAGLLPLVFSEGAGEVGNRTLGAATAGGMLFGTIFGLFLVPALYVVFAPDRVRKSPAKGSGKLAHGAVLLLVGLVSGCRIPTLAPGLESARVPMANTRTAADTLPLYARFFPEKELIRSVDSAFARNPEVRLAQLETDAAAAQLQASRALGLPGLGAGGSPALRKFGLYTMDGAGNASTDILPGRVVPEHLPDFFLGFQSSWEVDIWGRLKARKKAAQARFLASEAGQALVSTRVVAEVASAWYEWHSLKAEESIVRQNQALQERALRMTEIQKQAARSNALPVKQFEARLAASRAQLAEIRQRSTEARNRLRYWTGEWADSIFSAVTLSRFDTPASLPDPALPGDVLLFGRPDVQQASLEVYAAKFDAEALQKAFLPGLGLSGSLGLQAFRPDKLAAFPQSLAYGVGASFFGPLVNRRGLKAEFAELTARQKAAVVRYEQTVFQAFLEIASLKAALVNWQEAESARLDEVKAAEEAVAIADELFRSGSSDYLDVLFAQQNALEARLALLNTRRFRLQSTLHLYRALGGGRPAPLRKP